MSLRPKGGLTSPSEPKHIFSIDVEDYYHVSNFDSITSRDRWLDWEQRVGASTHRMLDLLEQKSIKSYCYFLGWVAERYPELVRRAVENGHIIGSHTYWHRMIHQHTPTSLHLDLGMANDVLSKITNSPIRHFRAPTFSITKRTPWAVPILKQHGFEHDSSVVPVRHDKYGIPDSPLGSYYLQSGQDQIAEHPVSVLDARVYRLPIGGGGYFRIFPWWFTRWALRKIENSGRSIHFYIHPWEIDPGQPVVERLSKLSRFRHYRNLHCCYQRLEKLFDTFHFGRLELPKPQGSYLLSG
ncbi:MAG: XrtA system polysaccharide deacetylase [Planctomycetota bacterium]